MDNLKLGKPKNGTLRELTDQEVNEVAIDIVNKQTDGVPDPTTLTEESRNKVNDRMKEIEEERAPKKSAQESNHDANERSQIGDQGQMANRGESDSELEDGTKVLPGGVLTPEGYEFVGHFSYDDETANFAVHDVLDTVKIEEAHGISLVYEGGKPGHGALKGRLIHDGAARVYVFRKDDELEETTTFKATLGHG